VASAVDTSPGSLLRDWRQRRRLSQLDLALEAGVSARHLSFLETGRSRPSREMVLHLSEQLDVPLRDRNQMLLAAGFAPAYAERAIDAPEMAPVREALDRILKGHEPYPAVVVDRWWDLAAANAGVALLTSAVAPHLLEPPANALRITLHPEGMAPHILNLAEWRAHLLDRLRRQIALTGNKALQALEEELRGYPGGEAPGGSGNELAVPLRLRSDAGELAFISTITTFGTAVEVTASELSIESFFPANPATAEAVREYVERLPAT
jgi:transcriptional regulator with XRE-family HTH domain